MMEVESQRTIFRPDPHFTAGDALPSDLSHKQQGNDLGAVLNRQPDLPSNLHCKDQGQDISKFVATAEAVLVADSAVCNNGHNHQGHDMDEFQNLPSQHTPSTSAATGTHVSVHPSATESKGGADVRGRFCTHWLCCALGCLVVAGVIIVVLFLKSGDPGDVATHPARALS